jgi:hypothetical protein
LYKERQANRRWQCDIDLCIKKAKSRPLERWEHLIYFAKQDMRMQAAKQEGAGENNGARTRRTGLRSPLRVSHTSCGVIAIVSQYVNNNIRG